MKELIDYTKVGTEFPVTGKDAGKIRLYGKPVAYKATEKTKKGIAKLALAGVTEYQQMIFGNIVFTTHDQALIALVTAKQLGEIDFTVQKGSTVAKPRIDAGGFLSRAEAKDLNREEKMDKWLDVQTFVANPQLLSKMTDINALIEASA
jgi:hypothetical protein